VDPSQAPQPSSYSFATVGVDPAVMGIGPIPATRKALARAGIRVICKTA
jgi:acetyl-CoA acyltransferase